MFLEHDDIYRGGGNQYIILGPKLVDPPAGPRENIFVIDEMARRLGVADRPGFGLTARQHLDWMLDKRGFGDFETFRTRRQADVQPDFETAHFLKGFAYPDGKFRFRPAWTETPMGTRPPASMGLQGPWQRLPEFPHQMLEPPVLQLDANRRSRVQEHRDVRRNPVRTGKGVDGAATFTERMPASNPVQPPAGEQRLAANRPASRAVHSRESNAGADQR